MTGTRRWVALSLLAVTAFAVATAWLMAPRPGARLDPEATSPNGARALVTLLREAGVDVLLADTVDDVERAAGTDTLLLIAQTANTRGELLLDRLADAPGDRLVLEPTPASRRTLAPRIRLSRGDQPDAEPNCDLREANRAGLTHIGNGDTYDRDGDTPLTRCYGGALVRYQEDGRTITVAGSADFMTNQGLLKEGNAALAMNLAGGRSRLVWYAPRKLQGERAADATISELIPDAFGWVVLQLCLVVVLLALWQGRRLGAPVAERLPVVVRASETVEGRARLYRSRRARARAGSALRTATLQRMTPRLGLGVTASESAVVTAVSRRSGHDENTVRWILFGPEPGTDTELCELVQALDDIERQVKKP